MQQRHSTTQMPCSVRPLGPVDYATPVAWWGWSEEPPVAMTITELVAARDLDARTAALAWLVLAGHGSVLIAAQQPHSGKTTLLTALLDLVPERIARVYLRGGAETFEFLQRASPRRTLLLANELSAHLPVYLWGVKAVRSFHALRDGYAIGATLHADSAGEAIAQLRDELGADPRDLACIDLLIVMRERRVRTVHRLRDARSALVRLDGAEWAHDRAAETSLVAERHGIAVTAAERAIATRAGRIAALVGEGALSNEAATRYLAPLNDRNEGEHA
ncbi:MAG TPA: hypothetical protein VGT60_09290 [Candidatus Limnocylindria bacterium]|nr:hypothetical protein [Candidatus Limnocylindria bacterium]